jgi:threonine aldolase
MINLRNDYSEICHPGILDALKKYAYEPNEGYGNDSHSKKAAEIIKEHLCDKDCDVHFLINGTGTNKTVLAHMLLPYQAVIACRTGHINVHETGAIESSGHKVLTCEGVDGKVTAGEIEAIVKMHNDEHMVMPKAVYISDATEIGTIYTLNELKSLHETCKRLGLYLYMDGARLGVALSCTQNDIRWSDLTKYLDVFCIGGTKNGALLGEAVVICNEELKHNFRYSIKTNGSMYAKGFVAGIEFTELFTNGMYARLATQANAMADILRQAFIENGITVAYQSVTNQLFPVFSREDVEELKKEIIFEDMGPYDQDRETIRFVTSWASKKSDMDKCAAVLKGIMQGK